MSSADVRPPGRPGGWNWRAAGAGWRAGSHVGGNVGGAVAFVATGLTFIVVASFDRTRELGGWACCSVFALVFPLMFGSLMGGLVGGLGGVFRAVSGAAGPGLLAGLGAALLVIGGVLWGWTAIFPFAPVQSWLVPLGSLVAILLAGPSGGLADPTIVRGDGSTTILASPFRRLFGIRPPPEKPPERWQPAKKTPGRSQGIERPEEGLSE